MLVAAGERGDGVLLRAGLDLEPFAPFLGRAPLGAPVDQARRRVLVAQRERDVPGHGQVHHEALLAAVLRHEAHAGGDGHLGIPRPELASVEGDIAGVVGVDAEYGTGHLGAAGADEAGQGNDFPGADLEADIAEHPGAAEAVHFQDHVADLGGGLGEKGANVAAHHLANDLLDGDVGRAVGGDVPAVPHHGDAVAQVKDFVETVRNEEDAGPAVPEAPGHGEQPFHLDAAEGCRGLVHHQDFGVQRNGLGDFNDLLVRDGQAFGDAGRVDRNAEPLEQLARLPYHGRFADEPEAALGLAADENVLRDAQVGEERGFLVDDRDSGVLALGNIAELDALACHLEVAGIGVVQACEDFHQSGLAGAVLADECVDFAGLDVDGAVGQGDHRAEGLGCVGEREDRNLLPLSGAGPGTVCLLHKIDRTFGA
ncbi:hypothetical protein SRABI128_04345 [Microbacterium sp. Bi128]|nr:hypothetical protein SRABI128_04345 [Microbacterium sp. Bi128]